MMSLVGPQIDWGNWNTFSPCPTLNQRHTRNLLDKEAALEWKNGCVRMLTPTEWAC